MEHWEGRSAPVERLKMSWKDSLVLARIGFSSSSVPSRYKSVWVRTGPSRRGWRIRTSVGLLEYAGGYDIQQLPGAHLPIVSAMVPPVQGKRSGD